MIPLLTVRDVAARLSAAAQPGAKVRWEFGPGATQPSIVDDEEERDALRKRLAEVDAAVRAAVGTIHLPGRSQRNGPLFATAAGAR